MSLVGCRGGGLVCCPGTYSPEDKTLWWAPDGLQWERVGGFGFKPKRGFLDGFGSLIGHNPSLSDFAKTLVSYG